MATDHPQPNPLFHKARGAIAALLPGISPGRAVELFVMANLAFLTLDIAIAHAVNSFANPAEWIPLIFSAVAPVLLLAGMLMGGILPQRGSARGLGMMVGFASVLVGISGLVLHLNSQFFAQWTLKSLVYTAPFAAPLAYAGLGLLLILDRMIDADSPTWAWWLLFLAWGGFIGNFILSLADHAQNGFFHRAEWIAVAAAALAVGFLLLPLIMQVTRQFLWICAGVMAIQAAVGGLGFAYHVYADLHGPSVHLRDNFLFGAPAFAPLLFANLAVLGAIALWALACSDGNQDRRN